MGKEILIHVAETSTCWLYLQLRGCRWRCAIFLKTIGVFVRSHHDPDQHGRKSWNKHPSSLPLNLQIFTYSYSALNKRENFVDGSFNGGGFTPADDAELEDVSAYVGVEDLDQSDVHVDGLQAHPGEGGQQEVVQQHGHGQAQPAGVQAGQPPVQ